MKPFGSSAFQSSRVSRRSMLRGSAVGLTALALPGALAACSGSEDGGGTSGIKDVPQVKLPEPTSVTQFPEPFVGPRTYDRPKFGKGEEFTVVVPQDPTVVGDWNDNDFSKWLEERTGIKVKYEAVLTTAADGSQDLSKINAMLASGDIPDAFLGVGLTGDQVSLYGQQGLFLKLDDYIQTYAPMTRQMMSDEPTFGQNLKATDGSTYMMGGINDCYHCRSTTSKAFINTKYLQQVGLEMPTTLDEFRTVLKTLKDENPSGEPDFLPLIGNDPSVEPIDVFFVNPFTYNPGEPWIRLNNGKCEFVANTNEWREALKYLRTLSDDGTLTPQIFSIRSEELVKLGNQGKLGVVRAFHWGSFLDYVYEPDALWHDYEPLMPLKGPGSPNGLTSWDYQTVYSSTMVISAEAKNPELLVQWADYMLDLEAILRQYDRGGAPGEGWDWAKKGEKGLDGRQAVYKISAANEGADPPIGQGWNQIGLMYRSLDYRNGQYYTDEEPTFEKNLLEITKQYEEFAQPQEQQLPDLIFDEESATTLADIETTIVDHVKQSFANFATGKLDINDDAAWQSYLDKLNAMQLDQFIQIYQGAYDNRPK